MVLPEDALARDLQIWQPAVFVEDGRIWLQNNELANNQQAKALETTHEKEDHPTTMSKDNLRLPQQTRTNL